MTTTTFSVEDELRHIRDLVVVRDALRVRGATPADLQECDATIRDARRRLAELAQRSLAVSA
jgi:hypothetical protein